MGTDGAFVGEWNFDEVPDSELVACCFWEYARESEFIRSALQQYREWFLAGGLWEDERSSCGSDIERINSIVYAAEVIVRGCAIPPVRKYQSLDSSKSDYRHPHAPIISSSFPSPWLSLAREERRERARIRSDRSVLSLIPIKRGDWHDANDIARWAEGRWQALRAEFEKVRRAHPEVSEDELVRDGKLKEFPGIQPSLYWEGGGEVTVVSIQWADFTNEEIIASFRKWVKANRPQRLGNPDARGRKPKDWRANLTRLAVMRLLSRFTALQLVDGRRKDLPAIWDTKQFASRKWADVTKWHDARREAGRLFHKLFPFLPAEAKPISWDRQRSAK